jgi:hypothetical protein
MMSGKHRRPSGALIVAVIALVVALAGTAVAGPVASLTKKLIDGSSIKKHSIPANRLEDHSITAQQLKASKLGTLPHAKIADTAANAVKLGGAPPSAYLPASKLIRWNFGMNKGSAARAIALGPMKLVATCVSDGPRTDGKLAITTTENGSFVSNNLDSLPGPLTLINAGDPPYPIVEQDSTTPDDGNSGELAAFDPKNTLAVFSTAQTIGLAINTPGADCRFFGYLVNDA